MELPLADVEPPRERADAARNRARVLDAAARLLASPDAGSITMEQIAEAAGVGKGTLYRRYPNVAAIAMALLDEHERSLQERMIRGAPPLGPGGTPADRLAAFYGAMVDLLERHSHLALAAETGERRFATGAYRAWAHHVQILLAQAGLPEHKALVDLLLAPLAPDVYAHLRASGRTKKQIASDLQLMAQAVLGGAEAG